MKRRQFLAALPAAVLASAGCTDSRSHTHAVYMLVDTSGTYAQEASKAQLIINYLLGSLEGGDSLAVARVQSRSFSEKDIIAKATFDSRPTQATAQKRAFRERIDTTFRSVGGSRYTDITGALIQGAGPEVRTVGFDIERRREARHVHDQNAEQGEPPDDVEGLDALGGLHGAARKSHRFTPAVFRRERRLTDVT